MYSLFSNQIQQFRQTIKLGTAQTLSKISLSKLAKTTNFHTQLTENAKESRNKYCGWGGKRSWQGRGWV